MATKVGAGAEGAALLSADPPSEGVGAGAGALVVGFRSMHESTVEKTPLPRSPRTFKSKMHKETTSKKLEPN